MTAPSDLLELCETSAVAPGHALKVEAGGLILAVFNIAGKYFVTDDACTHGPGSLSEGCIEGTVVECDFHNGAFDVCTGEVVAPPCVTPLRTYAVQIVGDKVCVNPNRTAQD